MAWEDQSRGSWRSGAQQPLARHSALAQPAAGAPAPAGSPRHAGFLLKSLPLLAFAAELGAGRLAPLEATRRSESMLRGAERSFAALGGEADRSWALLALRLLLAELAADTTEVRGGWAPTSLGPASDSPPSLHAGLAALALRPGSEADCGILALWRACLALSPKGRAGAPRVPLPSLAPDLVWTAPREGGEKGRRLILVGHDGSGKTRLLEGSGLGFRPAGAARGSVRQRWRAGAAEAIEAPAPADVEPGAMIVAVLPADRPLLCTAPPAAEYLVLTGIDRLPGFQAFFADLTGAERDGPCGALATPTESAAPAFAVALADRVLKRLAAEADAGERADLLAFAVRLADACAQVEDGERAAAGRPRLKGLFVTACPPNPLPASDDPGGSWFVRGVFEHVLQPGTAVGWTGARRAASGLRRWALLFGFVLGAGLLGTWWRGGGSEPQSPSSVLPPPQHGGGGSVPDQPSSPPPPGALHSTAPTSRPAPGPFSFQGTASAAYEQAVRPACQAATQELYPFFGSSSKDAAPTEMRRVFGPGGLLPSFLEAKLRPLISADGPVWRWRGDGTDGFDPATPELLAKLPALGALVAEGLAIEIEAVGFGGGVTGARLELLGAPYEFERPGRARSLRWRLNDQPSDSSLILLKGDRQVRRYQEGGVWSLLRLIDKSEAVAEADGSTLATFSDGEHVARFRLRAAGGGRPFERGGIWAFRCPPAL